MYLHGSLRKFSPNPRIIVYTYRTLHQFAPAQEQACVYPPIVDMSKEGQRRHQRQLWYDSIKALPTIEQKLYELSLHHRPRQKRYILECRPPSYNGVFFQRYITRTHLINQLPEKIMRMNVDKELGEIRDVFKETVSAFYLNNWKCSDQHYIDTLAKKNVTSKLVNVLISHCYKKLALKNDYILESTIQQTPRLNSFWFHGGFESKKDRLHEKNLAFQFRDIPELIIRMRNPLNPILSLDDPLCATAIVPDYHFHPGHFGFVSDRKWITSVPGHWFDDPCDFPFLLVFDSDRLQKLTERMKFYDIDKIKDSAAITGLFGWLNAVATYQGFTPFHDVTYPLVAQAVLTNGQEWNFFVYQLNTIAFHADVDNKDRRNICWSSGTIRLYDTIEDGQVKGFNDEVFKMLLKFFLNAPIPQDNVIFKPYLGEDIRSEEELTSMRFFYRRMYSQTPDPFAHAREIPMWQRIYMHHKDAKPMPFVRLQ